MKVSSLHPTNNKTAKPATNVQNVFSYQNLANYLALLFSKREETVACPA